MASSLAPECTPLKRKFDSCFNSWFEGYINHAAPDKTPVGPEIAAREAAIQASALLYDERCGALWKEYSKCLEVRCCHPSALTVAERD